MAHVLIIHEDDDIRDMLVMLMEEAGHTVRAAADNAAGLRELAECPPCVVLFQREWQRNDRLGILGLLVAAGRTDCAAAHQFVLLSVAPSAIPDPLAELVIRYAVPVIAEPFDMDELLRAVERAAAVLQPSPSDIGQ